MNDDACIITVNNTDYYYPCDRRDDIVLVGNSLVNTSSSTITLYHEFATYQDSSSGYPRITMPSNTRAYYRSSYNANIQNLVVSSASFKSSRFEFNVYLMIVIIGVLVFQLFKKG